MSYRQTLHILNDFEIYRIGGTFKTLRMVRKKYGPWPRSGIKDGVQRSVLLTKYTTLMMKE